MHAVNVLFVTIVIWLLFTWRAAERAGSTRAGGWLVAAAAAFGIGIGAHPLVGLLAIGIGPWLFVVDRDLWRRWRLVALCGVVLAVGLIGPYAFLWVRAISDPEPPLFYARPDTWERFRYLVFAEQFSGLFREFRSPLSDLPDKFADVRRVLSVQFIPPGWLLVALGAAIVAARSLGTFAVLFLFVFGNVVYSMNFNDGDIDRYYMPTIAVLAPLLGVAVATVGAACARAVAEVGRRLFTTVQARRRLAVLAGGCRSGTRRGRAVRVVGHRLRGARREHEPRRRRVGRIGP